MLSRTSLAKPKTSPENSPTNTKFSGWSIARAGLYIQMIHSGLVFNAFSLFSDELRQEFGWSNKTLGGAFALNRAESGLLGPLQGWMTDKWGSRVVLRIGAVIMAIGFFSFSTIDTVIGFYASYLLIALGSSLSGFLTITVTVVHWFERHRARALSVASMGFAIGGTLTFLVGLLIDQEGWRFTARVAAVVSLVVILPLSQRFNKKPADVGQFVDGVDPDDRAEGDTYELVPETQHFSAGEAMRTKAFWFISFGHAFALLVVGASMAHLKPFLVDETNLGSLHINIVIGSLPAMMGVGQIVGGFLGDLYSKRLLLAVAMIGHGGGILVLSVARSALLIWVFVLLHGIAWGLRGPLQQALRADYFGASDFGKIMGFSALIIMMGMVIGPIFAGIVADATGSFRSAFVILGSLATMGSLWFWFSTPPPPPSRLRETT